MRVLYRGNFGPSFSTESHIAASLEALGHSVIRAQENEASWQDTLDLSADADMFLWTSTYGYAHSWDQNDAWAAVARLNETLPTASAHLDLFWQLDRASQPLTEPWFTMQHVWTADGGHDELWEQAGVNHHHFPPGVFHEEAYDALPNPRRWPGKVAFVGSWKHYAHEEHWPVRKAMLDTMRRKFGRQFVCHPQRQAVRGTDLNELFATIPIIIGDSCLAGKIPNYWSDRVPETTGRGGFLIHPYIPGILNVHPDLVTYEAENWDELIERVEFYLANDAAREHLRRSNAEWTREHNCYTHRMQTVIDTVFGKGEKLASRDTLDASQAT